MRKVAALATHRPPATLLSAHDRQALASAEAFVLGCACRELLPRMRANLYERGLGLAPDEWETAFAIAHNHGLEPLLFKHIAALGLLPTVPESAATLKQAYCATLVTSRTLQIELAVLLAALRERDVEVLLLKGVALADRYYHEIALRPSRDLDFLVRREDLATCLRVLRGLGFQPVRGQARRLDFHVLRYLELQYRKAGGPIVEPHLELARVPAYQAALDVRRVWERSEAVEVGGERARYLDPADELRYLSLHYTVQHRGDYWIWLVDLAELVRSLPPNWDWEAFVRETSALGAALPTSIALRRAECLVGLELPGDVLSVLDVAAKQPRERANWRAAQQGFSDPRRLWRHAMSLHGAAERSMFVVGAGLGGLAIAERRMRGLARRAARIVRDCGMLHS